MTDLTGAGLPRLFFLQKFSGNNKGKEVKRW